MPFDFRSSRSAAHDGAAFQRYYIDNPYNIAYDVCGGAKIRHFIILAIPAFIGGVAMIFADLTDCRDCCLR